MFSKNSVIALLLTVTLLAAPAVLAAPAAHSGIGWLAYVGSFFADFAGFFRFDKAEPSADRAVKEGPAPTSKYCEGGSYPDPNGCP